MNRSEAEIIEEIVISIRSGFALTSSHLIHLIGANDEILKYIKANATNEDLSNSDEISEIHAKFSENPHITEQMLILVMNYLKVRRFLNTINVPYFDIDENQLINGAALLGSKTIEKIKSTEEKRENSDQTPNGSQLDRSNGSVLSSSFSDITKEEEMLAAALADQFESQMDAQEPLKTSQKSNLSNEIKKYEAKPPVKMPAVQSKTMTSTSIAKKRTAPMSMYRVEYYSDSDSDDKPEPQNVRALPQWLTAKRKPNPTSASGVPVSVPVRKKSFL